MGLPVEHLTWGVDGAQEKFDYIFPNVLPEFKVDYLVPLNWTSSVISRWGGYEGIHVAFYSPFQ